MIGSLPQRFRVKSVVSDLFHTLVDPDAHRPQGFVRAHEIASVLGINVADEFADWWGKMEVQRHLSRSKTVAQYADEYLLEHTGHPCTKEQLEDVNRIWGHMHDEALLKPDSEVLSALMQLRQKGLKLGLLSNIDEREAVSWTMSPLSSMFDVVCMSCDIGYSKPSKEAYSVVLSRLGEDAATSLYVGDGSHDELRGARDAGFGLVVFMKGFISRGGTRSIETMKRREVEADATIMNLNELVSMVDPL